MKKSKIGTLFATVLNKCKNNKRYNTTIMSKNEHIDEEMPLEGNPDVEISDVEEVEGGDAPEDAGEVEALKDQLNAAQESIESMKKEHMFLMAEFDNFRKRTLKEKSELLKSAGEQTLKGLLPIVDDFERGLDAIKDSSDAEAVKAGMELIYNKLVKYLESNGVKPIESNGATFDADLHEAIAMVPTPDESMKGKVIDTVSKGYTLNDKVIRHAKVAVGQ